MSDIENSYKKLCEEVQYLKKEMGLDDVSDARILYDTIVQEHPLSPWAFNIKMLVSLIEKKQEYESFVKHVAYDKFGAII